MVSRQAEVKIIRLTSVISLSNLAHSIPDQGFSTHRLLIGTHTSEQAQNYLEIVKVTVPNAEVPDPADFDEETGEIGGFGTGKKPQREMKFEIIQKIDHEGEVNKARYMPQNPNLIATMCADGRALIFDRSKHPLQPTGNVNPQIELHGHTKEGFGLHWNPNKAGQLVTGSEDCTVKLW